MVPLFASTTVSLPCFYGENPVYADSFPTAPIIDIAMISTGMIYRYLVKFPKKSLVRHS